jgi:tetratricopeptide (TPR) repeat protein
MSGSSGSADLALAAVLAHCGGSPAAAMGFVARAVAADPSDPRPFTLLEELRRDLPAETAAVLAASTTIGTMLARAYLSFVDGACDEAVIALGAVTGYQPDVPWASAPWFTDSGLLDTVSAGALAEGTLRIGDHDRNLDTDTARRGLAPWLRAIEVVCVREPDPDAMARMAILLRTCGQPEASLALCDQADAVRPVMLTEVVRAGTWRALGNQTEATAAFQRALALDPTNWSLYLDLADLAAETGDFIQAAAFAAEGEHLEPGDVTMRAAAATYRACSTRSTADLTTLADLAPQVPEPYRQTLLDHVSAAQAEGPRPAGSCWS